VQTLSWDRQSRIGELRERIWLYLTPSVEFEQVLLQAAALLQLPPEDVLTLGRLHFLLSGEVGALLEGLPVLIRRLSTTTAHEEERSAERVRGTVQWGKTFAARAGSGLPHLFVTSPARRAYQTPENELLVFVLDAIARTGRDTQRLARSTSGPTTQVAGRLDTAQRWRSHRALSDIERRPVTPRSISRTRSGRKRRTYAVALAAYEVHRRFVGEMNRQAIREAVEARALVTRDDPTLFELLCLFRVIESLQVLGWTAGKFRLFGLGRHLRLRLGRGREVIDLHYQGTPQEFRDASLYRILATHHGVGTSPLIPDVVLCRSVGRTTRYLVIEAKLGDDRRAHGRSMQESARDTLKDLLMYRHDFSDVLRGQVGPYGLGVAWGGGLSPREEEVMLASPDMLSDALAIWLAASA